MTEEVYNPSDARSPFTCEGSYMGILYILTAMQSNGVPVSGLVEACKQLADAQSRRGAVAAQILPVVHWVRKLALITRYPVLSGSVISRPVWICDIPSCLDL